MTHDKKEKTGEEEEKKEEQSGDAGKTGDTGEPSAEPSDETKNLRGQLLRLKAEFDNYRRRVEREKEMRYRYGKQAVLSRVIDLVDVLDNAVRQSEDTSHPGKVVDGLKLLNREFTSFIEKEGIRPIESTGRKFDHDLHETVGFQEKEGTEDDTVLYEVQRGYMQDNEVLRHAKVIIVKNKKSNKDPESKGD